MTLLNVCPGSTVLKEVSNDGRTSSAESRESARSPGSGGLTCALVTFRSEPGIPSVAMRIRVGRRMPSKVS